MGSLCWNIGTGLLAVLIKLINWIKINHSIKIILILLANIIIYLLIDFVLFWLNLGVLSIEQIIIGILITNTICLPIFYFITLKIKKRLKIIL
ncbi:hypothetical protein C6B38_07795 [Spiroplasma sp. ChiS]|uniref:hypothetical protein n=1 Tax=Spiroplasma sp. ChiS TaxID=2099885 RepID=UPI000CF8DB6E|nr:hypothetical protein [Spiroplasma sp. ChiS]PQP78170.1 hypothetical protein C6B38_07795 [Spiroplasma sp. ChiS]